MACLNGYQGPAILTAVRQAGKAGQVKIVCFEDYERDDGRDCRRRHLRHDCPEPLKIGYQTIIRMDKYLRGDKTQFDNGKILIPSQSITKANLTDYLAVQKNQLLQTQAGTP